MSLVFNFKSEVAATANTFTPLPEGRYTCKILDAEIKQKQDKTGSYINVTLEVADGKYKNRKLWHILSLTAKSQGFVYQFLAAAKSSLVEADNVSIEQIVKDLPGKYVSVYAEVGVDRNETPVNTLKQFKPVEGIAASAPTASGTTPDAAPSEKKSMFA